MKLKKGFTLIELLVVVAIVGILASVTLGYLSSAKKKGNDTAVKTNLATVRSAAEIFYVNNNNSYYPSAGGSTINSACPVSYAPFGLNMFAQDKIINNALSVAIAKGSSNWCYADGNTWAVAVGLNVDSTKSWCVDSGPSAKIVSASPASAAINATTHLCN
ncbi:MAG: type II secretion system protein [Candidatus Paceibacterota bacterium]|jgi:prepilin-type N-terminal cleavage/methylation domain-containing protein